MVKEVIRTGSFISRLKKLDKSYLNRIEKLAMKIIENPFIGKPMRYDRKGTREFYASSFRLMYAYDPARDILIFINIYHKDEQ